jgi:peptidoglycan/xylan/chitin deacetylase (PgdA/CDA1 family)
VNDSTLHIAWTADDGPTDFTKSMIERFRSVLPGRPIPVTWFVQWDCLEQRSSYYATYLELQSAHGHEIGIHGVSAVANHISWFPSPGPERSFPSVVDALEGIAAFKRRLNEKGLRTKFVRAPTGLVSELSKYLLKLGVQDESQRAALARAAIGGTRVEVPPKARQALEKVRADLATLSTRLPQLGLHLWGGAANGRISAQSWEAESSGVPDVRDDTVNIVVQGVLKRIQAEKRRRSLVVLCHDTTQPDVEEVGRDILYIEQQAAKLGVRVVYHTMSSLFKLVVGRDP